MDCYSIENSVVKNMSNQAQFKSTFILEGWRFKHLGKNIWKIKRTGTHEALPVMTGSDVVRILKIPFLHRIIRISVHHWDSSLNDGTDPMDFRIYKPQATSYPYYMQVDIWREYDTTTSRNTNVYGESWEFEPCTYSVRCKTTAGDYVVVEVYVQQMGA